MPPKEIAMPRKRRLSKECQNRQDEIPSESSEDRQSSLTNIRERTAKESMAKQQWPSNLESKCLIQLQGERSRISEQRERKRQYNSDFFQRVKATETQEERETRLEKQRVCQARLRAAESPEQRERRLERERARQAEYKAAETAEQRQRRLHINERNQRVRETETPEQRQIRLEKLRTWRSKSRAAETEEQRKNRLENRRTLNARKKKNKENVVSDEPTVVIKEEPIEYHPELLASQDKAIKNIIKDNGDTVPVGPTVIIKEEPMSFDSEPSSSADIVIKDEFVVCSEDDTGYSADEPPSTEPTSHVTLSVACLGSGHKSCSDQ
ncbi:hypothetical protein CEXT_722121 [Caerostris extrusa]|uniref:STPR domain-containing protein n=1 Tax=Caerostris extrusa TaxID=172846 RepID=A0AAV4PNG2_CAEEX|nr:hypothetical protein CEXT_722121 [Caerostris extrusa]